jgi:hypothetical protein
VANEPVAVFVAISVPSSEIMQASMSKRWAWPPKVPTDETPLCRLLAATAQGCPNGPSDCSDRDGQNSSADNPEEPPLRVLRHALFAEWSINRHQHARSIRAMVLVHNFAPPRSASIGIVHSVMHMKRAARSTATSGSTLQLRVTRRFRNR